MKNFKSLVPKAMWIGTMGLGAMLLGWTPSCKAQEVSPAIFTDSGMEDVTCPALKPAAKKTVKTLVSTQSGATVNGDQTNARKQSVHHVARKTNVAASTGL
jgi:hypothetical protein